LREDAATQQLQLGWGERPISELDPAELLASLPPSAEELNAAYEAVFGLLVSGGCPPYETEYIDSKLTFQRSQGLADIAGFYRAFGWMPSSGHPERPDHIALELEFMATLCGMELRADDEEHVCVCRDAQAKFLSEHLVWWAPALAKLLVHEDGSGFYGAAGRFLAALMPAHRALLGVPAHSGPATPSLIQRPDECDGCLLQPSELG
jgi:TorA maturation chaperone TorD